MKACATAWPTASIILLSRWASVNGWKDGRLNFLITSPDLLTLYDLRHSRLNFLHQLFIFLLLFFFELIFRNSNLVLFTDCRFISNVHHVEAFGPTRLAKRCVDAKINTLEPEGKCSPSHEKSTKRASQFDLELTREKTKSNSRAYRLEIRISLTQAYRQTLPIQKMTKEY